MSSVSSEIRRKILIIEDNEMNREILSSMLEDEYEPLFAENGLTGFAMLEKHYKELSIVILDVYMPVCNGFEFLAKVSERPELATIPVIVATGSDTQQDEAKCLGLGAVDFIKKPYNPIVVPSRIRSIVRFRESMATLSVVERDELTGLYTMQAFYHRMGQAMERRMAKSYTLAVADIHNFKLITTVFGKQKADETLQFITSKIKIDQNANLCARKEDLFFLFLPDCPKVDAAHFDEKYPTIFTDGPVPNIQLKIGIYENIDITQAPIVLCRRVQLASERAKIIPGQTAAFYDQAMHEELVEKHVIESSILGAMAEGQLQPYFQPKVDVQTGEVVGAEALVRWIKPDGSMLPPYKFIPLIEQNGEITRLDEYMFRAVCRFQKERMKAGKKVVPVSINLSRNSIYRKDVLDIYLQIVREDGISADLVPIELTESAAVYGKTILELTNQFADAGFSMHMDDFGSGVSSLASLTTMPFHVIKMDKTLIDQIGTPKGDVLIEHLIMIAHKIGEHVVAEGVERSEQVEYLRSVHCDVIQGYYFYKPVCRRDFENILDV